MCQNTANQKTQKKRTQLNWLPVLRQSIGFIEIAMATIPTQPKWRPGLKMFQILMLWH